ncbi:MAG: protein phosphatase 2C domain-containing protein [Gemmataceae bacterium]
MSKPPSDPSPPPASPADPAPFDEVLPGWDIEPPLAIPVEGPLEGVPLAIPVPMARPVAAPVPLAAPVVAEPPAEAEPIEAEPVQRVDEVFPLATPADLLPPEWVVEPPAAEAAPAAPPAAAPTHFGCPACGTNNPVDQPYCSDCGYYFSPGDLPAVAAPVAEAAPALSTPAPAGPTARLQGRYELGEMTGDRLGVQRFRATDHGADGNGRPAPVVVVRQPMPQPAVAEATLFEPADDEILPSFDDPVSSVFPATEVIPGQPAWPSVGWERRLLRSLELPGLPAERDYFSDDAYEYLVLEVPTGRSLWDAWDDPQTPAAVRYGYLIEVAETLHRLHACDALVEGLRPDILVVGADGRVRFTDIGDLLPLPFPSDAPVRGDLYTAPELLTGQGNVDARADLYGFGAMLYALHVGRELNEKTDFDGPGKPKPFIPRFPDVHPAFGRLMMKTFRREVHARFPTDEAGREDATGFQELIRTLEVLGRTADNVRLEVASWTSTGIVRTGNEDAFAVLHGCESRQDDVGEAVLAILCDGMGGYEAGEVAAALTIQSLRSQLAQLWPFNVAAGACPFETDPLKEMSRRQGHHGPPVDVEAVKQAIKQALKDANRQVFQTSRAPGTRRRGMGCTAEAVYVDGRNVIAGHVGDSRVYHLHEGRLVQLTRDQTLVNRLVELGTLTAEEAETHPRRNELQQAIGGQPDVDPGLYHGRLVPGDWVVVCSDGLTNHVTARDLEQMLLSEAGSAQTAARRLVNLTLIEGATDNVTVVVIRAT